MNHSLRSFLCFCLVIANFLSVYTLAENQTCSTKENAEGICIDANDCRSILNRIETKQMQYDDIVICSYKGKNSIVCCPIQKNTTENTAEPSTEISTENRGDEMTLSRKKTTFERICDEYVSDARNNNWTITLSSHVILGSPVEFGEYPHMAALGYKIKNQTKYLCGGTIVSENYVITAAHCVEGENIPQVIRMGSISLNTDTPEDIYRNISRIIVHPEYDASSAVSDIALLQMETPIELSSSVHPACLNHVIDDPNLETELIVLGWGVYSIEQREQSNILLKATLRAENLTSCNETLFNLNRDREMFDVRFNNGLNLGQICAQDGKDEGRDTCEGDSGGPLQIDNYKREFISTLVGITSFGLNCGTQYPAVYTRVAFYSRWIESIVWPN